EANGIKEKAVFDVKLDGKKIGKVQISSVKGALSLSYGQLQPDKDLDLAAIAKAASVSLVPSTKLASK
ncbi:MAG: hypothetical protein EBR95_07230, partial [Verrucomicrobia bacterium]|nr:hypothetical protein [Verrucomicrobiota bacterium]